MWPICSDLFNTQIREEHPQLQHLAFGKFKSMFLESNQSKWAKSIFDISGEISSPPENVELLALICDYDGLSVRNFVRGGWIKVQSLYVCVQLRSTSYAPI